MQRESLRLIFLLFSIFLLIQALSGILLFVMKIGYSPERIAEYFRGSEEKFILAKSFWGILEIAVFHLGGVCLYVLFMSHFLFLFPINVKIALWIIYASSLGDILSGFLIRYGGEYFSFLKVIFFVFFELAMLYFIGALIREFVWGFLLKKLDINSSLFR